MSVRVRFAEPTDAGGMLAIYGPYCEASPVSFEAVAPSVEQMAERIARVSAKFPWLVCEIDGAVAGFVYASGHRERAAYRWAVEVAAYVAAQHRRRGVAAALYSCLFALLRQQGYYKAFAGITLPNEPSVAVHEAAGFLPIGVFRGVGYKLGEWRDVGWWQLDLHPEHTDPPEPRSIGEIRGTAAADAALTGAAAMVRGQLGD